MKTSCMRPAEMFAHWQQVRQGLIELVALFTEEELSYEPFPGSWPVGRILLHIADTEDYWLHSLVEETLPVETVYQYTPGMTRDDILAVLAAAHERTLALLDRLDDNDLAQHYRTPKGEVFTLYWILWHVLEHEIHHRGELSLALGLLGRPGLDV